MGKPELEDCVIEGANRLGLVVGIVLGCAAALATEGWTLIPNSAAIIIPLLPGLSLPDLRQESTRFRCGSQRAGILVSGSCYVG